MIALLFTLGLALDLLWFACVRVQTAGQAAALSAAYASISLFCSWQVIEAGDWGRFAAYVGGQTLGAYAYMRFKR